MGIASALSQINIMNQKKDSSFMYDEINDVIIIKAEV